MVRTAVRLAACATICALGCKRGTNSSVASAAGLPAAEAVVTASGRGVVAVASVTGTVHLSGGGKTVEVNKGEVSKIVRSDPPSPPAAALRRVLLSVEWPRQRDTNRSILPLSGRVEPGSRVFVQGQPVLVELAGTFRAEVPLKQGKQKVAVVTVDALGRRKEMEKTVKR